MDLKLRVANLALILAKNGKTSQGSTFWNKTVQFRDLSGRATRSISKNPAVKVIHSHIVSLNVSHNVRDISRYKIYPLFFWKKTLPNSLYYNVAQPCRKLFSLAVEGTSFNFRNLYMASTRRQKLNQIATYKAPNFFRM